MTNYIMTKIPVRDEIFTKNIFLFITGMFLYTLATLEKKLIDVFLKIEKMKKLKTFEKIRIHEKTENEYV